MSNENNNSKEYFEDKALRDKAYEDAKNGERDYPKPTGFITEILQSQEDHDKNAKYDGYYKESRDILEEQKKK